LGTHRRRVRNSYATQSHYHGLSRSFPPGANTQRSPPKTISPRLGLLNPAGWPPSVDILGPAGGALSEVLASSQAKAVLAGIAAMVFKRMMGGSQTAWSSIFYCLMMLA